MNLSISTENMSERRGVLRRSGAGGGSALLAGGAVGSAVLLSLFASPAGAATTFTVDTNADGVANASDCTTPVANSCSLRDALAAATTDGDVIVFAAALSGQTITLSQGQLDINAGIAITGLGSTNLTVDAATNSRVFYITSAYGWSGEVVISGLSIINGDATGSGYGGGIEDNHDGDLTLDDVSITGCVASYGGAVYKDGDGTLEIVDSTISDNYAENSAGARYNNGVGDLIITNSTFDGNAAGGDGGVGELGNDGNITITGSTFSNNAGGSVGGAFYFTNDVTGDVSISGSSFIGNEASGGGGAIYADNSGSFTVTSSTFSGNVSGSWGGALYLGSTGQVVTVTDSLFADNYASSEGGAIDSDADDQILTINNSTFVGNSSGSDGGAIWKEEGGSLTINMSTITENSAVTDGGGVWFDGDTDFQADVTITGTILTGNTGFEGAADDLGSRDGATSQVATISDSILGVVKATITVTASNNIDATAPGFVLGLAALADNGGCTETMALLTGSPAIDAGPATVPTFIGNDFDQRGTPYVRVYNGQSDIGAFEFQPDPEPTPSTTTTVAPGEPVVPAFTG
jgi:predicted outer membrane repeat protein